MSKKSASPAPRVRSSEDKLYQSCLQACIEGIENLPVNKRQVSCTCNYHVHLLVANYKFLSVSATLNNNTLTLTTTPPPIPAETANDAPIERAATPPRQQESLSLLLSPPATPQRESPVTCMHSPASDGTMNRTPLHGAPVRGQAVPPRGPAHPMLYAYENQDARGNLAVQPAANAGTFKLKKNAVKIVSAPAPGSPFRVPSVASTAAASSPAPGPVKAKPKEVDRYVAFALLYCAARVLVCSKKES
jgi:hypothetical protein